MAQKQKNQSLRDRVKSIVDHNYFFVFITVVILINATTLGLETSTTIAAKHGPLLDLLDEIALVIFVIEIAMKLFAYQFKFFKRGWYVFDFVIVAISLIPAVGPLSVLRALRVLRVLRLVSVVPEMRRVISALLSAIPGMASIMAVLAIIFYVSGVLATKLFGAHPLPDIADRFDTLGSSLYTLFQIMTLEGWSDDIVRPVMDVYPLAWLFFIPFIIVASFAVLNLFIGVIVDAIGIMNEDEDKKEIRAIQKDITEIKKLLKAKK